MGSILQDTINSIIENDRIDENNFLQILRRLTKNWDEEALDICLYVLTEMYNKKKYRKAFICIQITKYFPKAVIEKFVEQMKNMLKFFLHDEMYSFAYVVGKVITFFDCEFVLEELTKYSKFLKDDCLVLYDNLMHELKAVRELETEIEKQIQETVLTIKIQIDTIDYFKAFTKA